MAGDARKIISNGTSAGGALSALLGTSGNAREYAPYLRALGATNATDDVFAVSAYYPITNLEHADAAYEWQFNGVNDYEKIDISMLDYRVQRKTVRGTQTAEQIRLSDGLKNLFPAYVNSLKLKNAQGVGRRTQGTRQGSLKTKTPPEFVQTAFCFLTLNPAETCQSSPRQRKSRFAARRAGRWQRWRVAPWAWRGRRQVRYRAGRFGLFRPPAAALAFGCGRNRRGSCRSGFTSPTTSGRCPYLCRGRSRTGCSSRPAVRGNGCCVSRLHPPL